MNISRRISGFRTSPLAPGESVQHAAPARPGQGGGQGQKARPRTAAADGPRRNHPAQDDTDILVVIDMQPYFDTSQKLETRLAVQQEIREAVKHEEPVLFVNYEGCGRTDSRLTELTESYPRSHKLEKWEDDGSEEIVAFIREQHIEKPHLRVCGVNTRYCVRQTVEGLDRILEEPFQIDVLGHACNTQRNENEQALAELRSVEFRHVDIIDA